VTTPSGTAAPDGDTVFEIGSITKAFTGILLADAVTRKEVSLDEPVTKFLPADLRLAGRAEKAVTLLHLATHRSGLPVQPPLIGLLAKNPANPYADFTRAKLAATLSKLKPSREPGQAYDYSNLGVGLLGHALVAATNAESYDALVRERVCRPLGLKGTGEALTGAQRARLARGHNAGLKPTDPWDFASLEACGGLRSTTNDLLAFAAANLGETKTPLLAVLRASHEKRAEVSKGVDIGLGWHRLRLPGTETTVIWHNGGTGGFRSMLAFTPSTERAVVVLCAADLGEKIDALALKVLKAVQPE
jgi:serine-type D-Ala-D-Ala carboxypeptidase/endopeptidase